MYSVPLSFIQFQDCEAITNCKSIENFIHRFASGDVLITQLIGLSDFVIDLEDTEGNLIEANIATFDQLTFNTQVTINLPALAVGCYRLKLKGFESQFCALPIGDICALPIGDICALGSDEVDLGCFYFRITTLLCYTEVVQYSNNESSFEFDYTNGYFNQIRLPIQIAYPQSKTQSQIYRTSAGQTIRVSANISKEYEFDTDYADEFFHDCMAVMLISDTIEVAGKRYVGNGDYDVEWTIQPNATNLAKGKGKVIFTPYNITNPNFI